MGHLTYPRSLLRRIGLTLALAACLALVMPSPMAIAAMRNNRSNYKRLNLAAAVLIAPVGTSASLDPDFVWLPVAGASSYEFELSDSAGKSVFRRDGVRETTFRVPGRARLTLFAQKKRTAQDVAIQMADLAITAPGGSIARTFVVDPWSKRVCVELQ